MCIRGLNLPGVLLSLKIGEIPSTISKGKWRNGWPCCWSWGPIAKVTWTEYGQVCDKVTSWKTTLLDGQFSVWQPSSPWHNLWQFNQGLACRLYFALFMESGFQSQKVAGKQLHRFQLDSLRKINSKYFIFPLKKKKLRTYIRVVRFARNKASSSIHWRKILRTQTGCV